MSKEKETMKELSLLKLARWTYTYQFVDGSIRDSFAKILCYAVREACSALPVWTEFTEMLHIEKELSETMGKSDAEAYAKIIKKRYSIKKGLFTPRLTYKYLFMAEVCYIYALLKETTKTELIDELCSLLSITKNGKSAIIQQSEYHLDPSWMLQTKPVKKWKGVGETIPLLSKFIQKENRYYQLPRKNVSMFSTMSSGKSTFVNALLGHDYLPSKNEACTAKVASISDIDHIDYCIGYAVKEGKPIFNGSVDKNKMLEWNNDPSVSQIILEGDFDRISSTNVVTVIHDTPGINYSGNMGHKKITLEHLVNSRPDVIVCLLDATQMLTTDSSDSLADLKKTTQKSNKAEIIFVINKSDRYDSQKEDLKQMIIDTASDLEKHGFENPAVIPVSAQADRLFKMALRGRTDFTEDEIDDFVHFLRFFSRPENDFSKLCVGIDKVVQSLSYNPPYKAEVIIEGKRYGREQIIKALFCTGIPVVENMLNAPMEAN